MLNDFPYLASYENLLLYYRLPSASIGNMLAKATHKHWRYLDFVKDADGIGCVMPSRDTTASADVTPSVFELNF